MGRCDRENADGVASVEVPANEEAGEKDGRVGVQGREVEKERMLAGRRTGDCADSTRTGCQSEHVFAVTVHEVEHQVVDAGEGVGTPSMA